MIAGSRSAACVAYDAREVLHEGTKTVDGRAVFERVRRGLVVGRGGSLGRRDRISRRLRGLVFVGEEQAAPRLAHVPLDVIGEDAEENVGAHAILMAVMDWPDLEVDGLDGAECALNVAEQFVAAHGVGSGETLWAGWYG